MRSNVDLPQPEGPTSTTNSPSRMSKLMPWMMSVLPKDFLMLRKDTEAMSDSQDLTAPAVRPDTM